MKITTIKNHKKKLKEGITDEISENLITKIFKYIQVYKKRGKRKKDLLEFVEKMLKLMGIPEEYALFILESYMLNFRKNGDYSNLTYDNFVDPRKMSGKWTPNTKANLYTSSLMPFKGSNLQGFWATDPKGVEYYEVVSYGWYPIYLNKKDIWYQVVDRYSSSTGRQMSNAEPFKYNSDLNTEVYLVSKDEMKMLKNGATHQEIIEHKLKQIKYKESELVSKKLTSIKTHQGYTIKFKIKSIDIEGDKAIVNVDVYDVLKNSGPRDETTQGNYLEGDFPNVDKVSVENRISNKLVEKFREFKGIRGNSWPRTFGDNSTVIIKFNHLKEK